jgi:sulfate transport system ATP-binding protein
VVIFNRGLVEQQGSPTDIIRRPRTPFVMKFVGETNAVPSTCLLVRRSGYMTKKPQVLFRPSDIQLFTEYKESVDGGHSVTPATVTEKFNLGWVVKYVLRFDDDVAVELGVSRKEADGPLKLDVGQRIYLYVPPGNMMGFEPAEVDSAPLV